ncbi:MAG: glycosyltransferase [Bryobacterales bacterium]|nr:glycosyltransferase [Bryobacterales bacterium]
MKPTLLHVLPGFGIGGTELRVANLIQATQSDFHHTVISIDGSREAARNLDIPVLAAPPKAGPIQFPLAMRRMARQLRPNLILTYNWGATDMILGARFLSPAPFIHNECGFNPDEAEKLIFRRVLTRRILLNTVFRTIVVSGRLLHLARTEFRLPDRKIAFIRTGVDVGRFHPGRDAALRAEWGVSENQLLFGYMGGLRGEKHVALLLEAFLLANVPNAKLAIVGDGPTRADLERLAAGTPKVVFAGARPDPVRCYQAFDAFLMSSLTEQTSNALLEAMATGLPCLVTDVGDNAACLGSGRFCVPSRDLQAFTAGIQSLAADPSLRSAAGAYNRARVENDFSFSRMVAAYRDLWLKATQPR